MKTPALTLVIPTYHVPESFLRQCFESVRNQTLEASEFEVVVFDDGSRDKTPELAKKFAGELSNARFYRREENKGPATRNDAIKESKGRLIALLDADDLLVPEALEHTLRFMEDNPIVEYSYGQHRLVDGELSPLGDVLCRAFEPELLLHMNFVGPVKCFSRRVHDQIGGYDFEMKFGEDWDHALKASEVLSPKRFQQNPEILYLYRIHGANMTLDKTEKLMAYRARVVNAALRRRGIEGDAKFSHVTGDGYNYMSWRKDGETFSGS